MTDFALEEWEWPPDVERRYLVEPFQSACLAPFGLTQITLCAVPRHGEMEQYPDEFLIFLRPDSWEKEKELLWFRGGPLPTVNYTFKSQWRLFSMNFADFDVDAQHPLTAEALEEFMPRGFPRPADSAWGMYDARYFRLPTGVCLLHSETGWWIQGMAVTTPFRTPPDLYLQSSAFIYQWLQEQLEQSDSEVRFAQQWHRQSEAQTEEALTGFDPHLAQWQCVPRLVCRAEPLLHDPLFYWVLTPQRADQEFSSGLWYNKDRATKTHAALCARLQLWGEILQRSFPLSPPDAISTPLCVLTDYTAITAAFKPVDPTPISAHERMESLLYLRDWAQDKATLEEMAILFPSK